MKKIFAAIISAVLLTGCANGGDKPGNGTISPDNALSDKGTSDSGTGSFSVEELDLLRLNAEKSNYSNSVNLKGGFPGKMCCVGETDTLFYSDQNGLFQQTGGKTVRLLETPVSALNIAGGNLYFIIPESEAAGHDRGKAYRMALNDGETECIIDEDVINISVYKDRIFYQKITEFKEAESGGISYAVGFFKCGLNGEERTQINDFAFSSEGDICVTHYGDSISIISLSDGTSEKLLDEPDGVKNLSIYNGSVYYIRTNYKTLKDVLISVNLSDKTVGEVSAGEYIEDYGFIDGKLCVYDLVDFYLDEDGKLMKYDGAKRTYKSLYTCGGKVYGMSGEKLYEIVPNNDNGIRCVSENEIGGVENEA